MNDACSIRQLSIEIGFSEKTIRKWIKECRLAAYRPTERGKMLVRRSDFEAFVAASRSAIQDHPKRGLAREILREFAEARGAR